MRTTWLGVVAVFFGLRCVVWCSDGDRLIDSAVEPPLTLSPDFAEVPLAKTGNADISEAFGPVAPAARQPTGALSGRIVFTNGGHGWTFDPSAWRLLRGTQNSMNEDYGNVDQMNFFATYCFNAGAIVVPLRPLGQQPREVVLDNDDAAVTYSGGWADSTSTIFYGSAGDVPYRYASLSSSETATATYTPNIPVAGYYPVYTWVRHGSDRGDQLYRIRHTGGESQVRIPHHMVGNGWVYLGEYYFNAGSNGSLGSVMISNLRSTATGTVVIADAIRFGNGMGSIDRGGGVSGYPREDESARYWIQASLGQGQAATIADGGGNDESDSWSAPPKMSAEMNREEAGTVYDRIHVSFHSNAGGGRGTLGLITGTPTTNQSVLAQFCGREVTDDLVALGSPPLEYPWYYRSTVTYTGGYSEIDGSLFNYEMDATIIEVAFHDSVEDAALLRDPKARSAIGKAAMHAVIKYMNRFAAVPLIFPPEPPANPRTRGAVDGSITLNWSAPMSVGGSSAPTGYVIYRSTDGYGFGSPISVGNVTRFTINGLAPGTDYYFRIAAVNSGGESLPSEVVGCKTPQTSNAGCVLVVNGFDRFDRTTNLRQDTTRQVYAAPDATGTIERVWPRRTNSFDYVVQHGKAIAAAGMAFDSCQNEAVSAGVVTLGEYPIVDWMCGQESTADETFSAVEQLKVTEFRAGGGHLFVSGSEIAWDLDRATGPTAADRGFFNSELKADFPSDANDSSGSYNLQSVATGIFAGRSGVGFDDGSRGTYWVQAPDVLVPYGAGASRALNYSNAAASAAAIQYDGSAGGGKVVYLGLPFETIADATRRSQYMTDILGFFTAPDVFVPTGAVWKYNDAGQDLGTAWAAPSYDDSAWKSGPAQLGFGDGDETTLVTADAARITTYFRRSFNVANPRKYRSLTLRLLRDDGAVVWLNGLEVVRSNMPASGPIGFGTFASAGISGTAENAYYDYVIDPRDLRTGENVIAVEVHQNASTSSDLSFDLQLAGTLDFPATLVNSGSSWRYRDNGIAPTPSWKSIAFDDSGWSEGLAPLGYGGKGEVTVIGYGANSQNRYPTTWLRRSFAVDDPAAFDALRLELQRDDGAVVYLNGVEMLRSNLPSGVVTSATLATTDISGTAEKAWNSYVLPATSLQAGKNVIAVELHQSSPSSPDLLFDLRLYGIAQGTVTYDLWKNASFGSDASNPAVSSEGGNPDGDPAVNLLEYGVGSSPTIPFELAPTTVILAGDRLALKFNRNAEATDLTFIVQGADDPSGPWIELARSAGGDFVIPTAEGVTVLEASGGATRAVEVRDAVRLEQAVSGRRFLRLQIAK